jgi:hypothetical protein
MDPITAIGMAGSAVGIAGFGLQIATVLQTYIEASLEADDRIREIANDTSTPRHRPSSASRQSLTQMRS